MPVTSWQALEVPKRVVALAKRWTGEWENEWLGFRRYRHFEIADRCDRRIGTKQRHLPEVLCNRDRRNLHIGPPGHFVAMAVQIPVMFTTQRDGKFVADLAPERSRLGKFEMMGIARRALADQAGLRCHKREMGLVALAAGLRQRGGQFGSWLVQGCHVLRLCI